MPVNAICQHCGAMRSIPPGRVATFRYCSAACYNAVRGVTDEQRIENKKRGIQEWRDRHPEKIREAQRRYYETHTEQRRGNTRKWRAANLTRAREYGRDYQRQNKPRRRAWLDANRDRHASYRRKYHARHPDKSTAYARLYRAQKPYIMKALSNKRRAQKTAAGGSFTAGEWNMLCELYDHACLACGKREPDIKLTADHVVPVSKGGDSYITNIQPLCFSCNSRKHDRFIDYRTKVMPVQSTLWEFVDDSHSITG